MTTPTGLTEEGIMSATAERNRMLAIRLGEIMNSRRYDQLDEIVRPDFMRHCQATPDVQVHSLGQFKEFLRQDALAFPDAALLGTRVLADSDMVAIWASYSGTQQGPLGRHPAYPPSGHHARIDVAMFLRIEDDMIAEMWVTYDQLTLLTQLGHMPALVYAGH